MNKVKTPRVRAAAPIAKGANNIRPFRAQISDSAIQEMRRRIRATRWPEKETVSDASQGWPLATMQELARYWGTSYDWRKAEAKLNNYPQFMTTIDGVQVWRNLRLT